MRCSMTAAEKFKATQATAAAAVDEWILRKALKISHRWRHFIVISKERPLSVFRKSFPSYPVDVAADGILPAAPAAFAPCAMLHLFRVTVPL